MSLTGWREEEWQYRKFIKVEKHLFRLSTLCAWYNKIESIRRWRFYRRKKITKKRNKKLQLFFQLLNFFYLFVNTKSVNWIFAVSLIQFIKFLRWQFVMFHYFCYDRWKDLACCLYLFAHHWSYVRITHTFR